MSSRPGDRTFPVFWLLKLFCDLQMSSRTNSSAFPPRNSDPPEPVFAKYVLSDGLVRMISTQKFYLKQIEWCVKSVSEFWRHIVRVRHGVWPNVVPMSLRFCISWLNGFDCTDWTARQVCCWLKSNVAVSYTHLTLPTTPYV